MNRNTDQQIVSDGKTLSIVAYLTIIGFMVAYIINRDKQNQFVNFHLRQGLGVALTSVVTSMIAPLDLGLGAILMSLLGVLYLVMLITGLINAANGRYKPVAALGQFFEEWFRDI